MVNRTAESLIHHVEDGGGSGCNDKHDTDEDKSLRNIVMERKNEKF
jgi:hypothetical protein